MQTVCIDDDDLLTPELEAVEVKKGFWMRSCPWCNRVLCKSSTDETLRCICGWNWQSLPTPRL
jgi:hypothetical protein